MIGWLYAYQWRIEDNWIGYATSHLEVCGHGLCSRRWASSYHVYQFSLGPPFKNEPQRAWNSHKQNGKICGAHWAIFPWVQSYKHYRTQIQLWLRVAPEKNAIIVWAFVSCSRVTPNTTELLVTPVRSQYQEEAKNHVFGVGNKETRLPYDDNTSTGCRNNVWR